MKTLTLSTLIALTTACAPDTNTEAADNAQLPVEVEMMIAKTTEEIPETSSETVGENPTRLSPRERANRMLRRLALVVTDMGCEVTTSFNGQYTRADNSFDVVGHSPEVREAYEAEGDVFFQTPMVGALDGNVYPTRGTVNRAIGSFDALITGNRLNGEMTITVGDENQTNEIFGIIQHSRDADFATILGVTAYCK
jgi:hypothetical protein